MGAVIGGWGRMLHVTKPKPFGAEYHRARRSGVPPKVPKMTAEEIATARRMYESGEYILRDIAAAIGKHTASVHKRAHVDGWKRNPAAQQLVAARLSQLQRDRHGRISA